MSFKTIKFPLRQLKVYLTLQILVVIHCPSENTQLRATSKSPSYQSFLVHCSTVQLYFFPIETRYVCKSSFFLQSDSRIRNIFHNSQVFSANRRHIFQMRDSRYFRSKINPQNIIHWMIIQTKMKKIDYFLFFFLS